MAGLTYKPLGAELSIASANTVAGARLIRVLNTSGSTQVLTLANTGGTYANITITNGTETVIQKLANDTVQMTGGLSVPIAYLY
jgi:hypothetical protein